MRVLLLENFVGHSLGNLAKAIAVRAQDAGLVDAV